MDTGSFYASMDLTAVSGIAGSISIACWIVVFSPQIIENFRRSSAEGLSVVFVVIWLVGDVFNILGAVLQGVLPTMVSYYSSSQKLNVPFFPNFGGCYSWIKRLTPGRPFLQCTTRWQTLCSFCRYSTIVASR